jgi:hypothetical protein
MSVVARRACEHAWPALSTQANGARLASLCARQPGLLVCGETQTSIGIGVARKHRGVVGHEMPSRFAGCSTLRVQCVRNGDINSVAVVFDNARVRHCCAARNFALTVIAVVNMMILTL